MARLVPCPTCHRHVFSAEAACPHCGSSGQSFMVALAVAATVGLAACSEPPAMGVYGPAPRDPDQRLPAPSSSSSGAPSASSAPPPPPSPAADVYGPAPRDPAKRLPPPKPSK